MKKIGELMKKEDGEREDKKGTAEEVGGHGKTIRQGKQRLIP